MATQMCDPALAQDDAEGLADIIVTARKVSENIQNSPVAVTAITAGELTARGITSVNELARSVPNLNITQGIAGGSSANAAIFIRGIGQRDFIPTVDPGVGVYRDGVYLGRSVGANLDFTDIERIEVIRGPQGTLYGKNTIGGAVNIITRRPSFAFTAEGRLTLGERDRFDLDATVSGPIIADRLAAKISAASRSADGYVTRITDGLKLANTNRQMLKGELLWKPAETLEVLLSVDGMRQRQESTPGYVLLIDQVNPNTGAATIIGQWNALVAPRLGVEPLTNATGATGSPYRIKGTSASYDDVDSWGAAVTVDWDLGNAQLRSITAYRDLQSRFSSPIQPIFSNINDIDQNQFSQELQLTGKAFGDRFDWLVGLYYFEENAAALSGARLWTGLVITVPNAAACQSGRGVVCVDFNSDNDLDTEGKSYAAFAQGTYRLTDRLSLTGGLRYTYEKKNFSILATQLQINRIAAQGSARDSWDDFSPMASLNYQATDDVLLYAKVARGFKSGGFNGRPNNTQAVQPVDPETVLSYEAGAKLELWDKRLRLNLAGFTNDYKNFQEVVSITDPNFGLLSIVENVGKLKTQGVEAEVTFRPVPALTLFGSLGYTDAQYKEIRAGAPFGLEDRPVQVPEWTTSLGAQVTKDVGNAAQLRLRADWSYNSGYENYLNNVKAGATDTSFRDGLATKSFNIVNVRATYAYQSNAADWDISVYARNLLNETYLVTAGYNSGSGNGSGVVNPPREIGLQLTVRY
ncbi:TonB-dependent receptor [Sphingobium algorifonticola]|nr:TonB-dependent receptor [Sphingobium algorifonticola]